MANTNLQSIYLFIYLFIYYGVFDNIAYYYLTLHSIDW